MSQKKGQVWIKALTKEMEQFEKETGKNAVYKGKVTGSFEYWAWMEDKRSKGLTRKKRSSSKVTKKKKEVELTYITFTAKQLNILTEKHKNKLFKMTDKGRKNYLPYRQIKILIKQIKINRGKPIEQAYKEIIIQIFDEHKVPYSKKFIVKRKELR